MTVFDPSRAAEDLAELAQDFERQAKRYEELQGRMTALAVTESSAGGRVSVTVDSNGVPTAITLSTSTRGMAPATVSAEIMSCMRRAQAKLRTDVVELVRDMVGDDPAGAAIVEGFTRRFPESSETGSAEHYAPPADAAPSAQLSSQPGPTPPAPWESPAPTPPPRNRKPDRDQIVTPDEPDPEDEYYNRKSWLV
ncbi:YbaB/EbfC family nucleoid-associated protein [Nocardia sp. NPDC005998]|uniref:YbaB/EbfC family nucleoid-associated protein n=1 Tax=Nocardia sp. NPDC005998 TaxID=3156894 RepID=UPI0033AEE3F5